MAHSPRIPWDEDEKYITKAVNYWARIAARRLRAASLDREDITQDLLLDLLRRLSAYDSRRSARRTFISRIVKNRALSLVGHHEAKMRDANKEKFSLDDTPDPEDADSTTYGELVGHGGIATCTDGRYRDGERVVALRIDLATAMDGLSPDLRRLAEMIAEGESVQEIARRLGIHRDTVDRRRAKIREIIGKRGLGPQE